MSTVTLCAISTQNAATKRRPVKPGTVSRWMRLATARNYTFSRHSLSTVYVEVKREQACNSESLSTRPKRRMCYLRRRLDAAKTAARGGAMNDLMTPSSKYRLATRYLRKVGALHAERNLAFAFLGCLTLALVLPLLQTFHPIFGTVVTPLEERRAPSPFPSPSLLLGTTGEFATALNNWFDDRVGFRDLFIRTKNQIDYTFFKTSKKVYVGSNGWLFLRGEGHAVSELDGDGLLALEESYVNLAQRLREKGVRLIVLGYNRENWRSTLKWPRPNCAALRIAAITISSPFPRRSNRPAVHRCRNAIKARAKENDRASLLPDRHACHTDCRNTRG